MTFYQIVDLLTFLSPVVLLMGVVIGCYYYKLLNFIHKSITWYMLAMLCVDLTSRIFRTYDNNLLILLVYSLMELILFVVFYYYALFKQRHIFTLITSIAGTIYIIWEISVFKKIETKNFQSYAKVVDDFIVIMLVLTFFYEKINIYKETKWDNFRLNAVILGFFSINLLFFLPYNFIINKSSGLQFYFWFGIIIITVLFYSYLTHSIWKNGRTRKLLPSGSR